MSARDAWRSTPMPAVVVSEAIGTRLASDVRDRLMHAGYSRFALLDRGSYEHVSNPREPELLAALEGIASEVTGRALAVAETRAVRLVPGDYVLVRHDRVHEDRPIELVLDLSPTSVPGAEVHYRHRGQVFFVFPSRPGALAIVERGPTVMCNQTYLSKAHANREVVRLVALLRERAPT